MSFTKLKWKILFLAEIMADKSRQDDAARMKVLAEDGSIAALAHHAPPVDAIVQPPAKKQRTDAEIGDPCDIPERSKLAGLATTREKVECIIRIRQQRIALGGKTSKNAIDFCKKYVNPVINCLEWHFQGNIETFCEVHKQMQHTTFKSKNCCGGKGSTVCTSKSK
jgi:hypothetical protein